MTDDLAPQAGDEPDWPLRAVILMAVGAVAALIIQQLMEPGDWLRDHGAWRDACATGVGVGALAFGFGLSRIRIGWTVAFAAILGAVAGLIVWWNGQPDGLWTWSGASLVLAIAIAVPLFQVARDEGRAVFPYTQVHGHAWTNVVLWGACWGFTGIVILLSHLLGELFALIGINVLKDLLNKSWPNALIIGAAFGGALALLRDRDRVVRLLQRVVTSVLGFLAPILGVALILFIVSLPFTGLDNLWEATKSTTPILMACVIGALILANAVIGHGPDDEAKNPVLRWSALALGVSILPLAVIAALAMGLRLNQYGLTPDRLWGLVCVVFAVGYGIVYFVAVVRKRQDWAPLIRRDNIRLAFVTMAVALVLTTPLLGFNAISVRDQVARLKSGKVSVAKFDWAALAFDFGEPGKQALRELKASQNSEIATKADAALKSTSRYQVELASENYDRRFRGKFDIRPVGAPLPDALRQKITGVDVDAPCESDNLCHVYLQPDGKSAFVIGDTCMSRRPEDRVDPKNKCIARMEAWVLRGSEWIESTDPKLWPEPPMTTEQEREALRIEREAIDAGRVEIREVTMKQAFIGDKPTGKPFKQP
jgi:hypothetical protein